MSTNPGPWRTEFSVDAIAWRVGRDLRHVEHRIGCCEWVIETPVFYLQGHADADRLVEVLNELHTYNDLRLADNPSAT